MTGTVPATAAAGTVEASAVITETTMSMVANWKTSMPVAPGACIGGKHEDDRPGDAAEEFGRDEAVFAISRCPRRRTGSARSGGRARA